MMTLQQYDQASFSLVMVTKKRAHLAGAYSPIPTVSNDEGEETDEHDDDDLIIDKDCFDGGR